MSGASFNRGRSKQDYVTPREFVDACAALLGIDGFAWDLAASDNNAQCEAYLTEATDSLAVSWAPLLGDSWGWLNPPFGNIRPWAQRCAEESARGARVALLVPASVGSEWFARHVDMKALVRPIRPRLSFDGKHGFPKDLMVAFYGLRPGFHPWRWRP